MEIVYCHLGLYLHLAMWGVDFLHHDAVVTAK